MKKSSQQGMTTLGWILVIAVAGMIVLTGLKVIPMYMEYYQVRSVMDSVVTDTSLDPRSKKELSDAIIKRLLINSIRYIKREHLSIDRENDKTIVSIEYEVRQPYVDQLFIGGNFSYSVVIDR